MKQEMYYSYQRLKDYALWYYFRYYPSNKKLFLKLKEKGSQEDTQRVIENISHLLEERKIIESKIENYIYRNKNYSYIRQKMTQKLFPKDLVEKYLAQYIESGKSIVSEESFYRKIENYCKKGKSKQYILGKLGETREDRELLEQLWNSNFYEYEEKNIKAKYDELIKKYTHKKCIEKLLAKGFNYCDIKGSIET